MEPTYKLKNIAGESIKVLVRGVQEWVSLNGICRALSLDREALANRLKGSGVPHRYVQAPTSRGDRSTLALKWEDLPTFLALIETKNPDLQARVAAWREFLVRKATQPSGDPSPLTDLVFGDPRAMFLFSMGVLYQRGELPGPLVAKILSATGMGTEGSPPSLRDSPSPKLPPAPPKEPPVVTAAPPEKGEVLTPLKVRPEGYLSARGVVDRIEELTSPLGVNPLQEFAQSGNKRHFHVYSRSTLAKMVGKLARALNIYPLPHEGDSYTPPPENLDRFAMAIPLRQLCESGGEASIKEVSSHVVYSQEAVKKIISYLTCNPATLEGWRVP